MFNLSIYKVFKPLINGVIVVLHPIHKGVMLNLKVVDKHLQNTFVCLGVKLNNKIYHSQATKNLTVISYKLSMFQLFHSLNHSTKMIYSWKSFSK